MIIAMPTNPNYRIQTMTMLDGNELPISEGLAIEKKIPDKDDYYVLCIITYNKDIKACEMDFVGLRLLDIDDYAFGLVKKLITRAVQLVERANKEAE